ncbi:MAG: NAD(P)/FAD-dependent oxidoreductase [Patescibacteria group bacterium]|jgi:protoporphyrinogen oxidase
MKQNIGVVGGGFTGLTAAYYLLKKGHKVTIFEKGNSLGGLAGGFRINGNNLEKAYHHIFKTDKDIISLSEELKLTEKLKWIESSIGIYYKGKVSPFVTPMDLLRFEGLGLLDKLRLGLVGLLLQKDKGWGKYIEVPAFEWMKKMCGKRAYRVIWEPLLKGKFHKYYDKVSMAWLWARIHTRGNSKDKGDTKEFLGYYDGGFQVLIDKLEEKIKKMGGVIVVGVGIEKVGKKQKKVFLKVEGKNIEFDKVVATVPSNVFAKIAQNSLDEKYKKQLSSIDYLGAIVFIFSSKQSLSKYYWHNINDINSPFLAFIQHTNLIDKSNYGDEEVYYMGTYAPHDHKFFRVKDEDVEKEYFDYLQKIFPNFDKRQVRQKFLFKLRDAQHVVTCDYPQKIPDYKTSIEGVYLANFSQIFPEDRGTNFAVREGKKIANLVG